VIVPLIRITPASTAELTSATVRKIAVTKLILLMLFIILISFFVLAFRDFPVSATFIPHSRAPARQGEISSGLHLCSSRLYKGKKSGAFQEKWLRRV
jgi:hypothetical protein